MHSLLRLALGAAGACAAVLAQSNPAPVLIPHIAAGGGWVTTVRILNPTAQAQEVRLDIFQPSGVPLRTRSEERSGYSHERAIPPQAVADIVLDSEKDVLTGYASLVFLTGAPLPHTVIYSGAGLQGALTKPSRGTYLSEFFQFDNTDGAITGVAYLIPDWQMTLLHRLTCHSANGALIGAYSLPPMSFRPSSPGGYTQIALELPAKLRSTAGAKGLCAFSYSYPSAPVEYKASRAAVALRFWRNTVLPLSN